MLTVRLEHERVEHRAQPRADVRLECLLAEPLDVPELEDRLQVQLAAQIALLRARGQVGHPRRRIERRAGRAPLLEASGNGLVERLDAASAC